MNVICHHADQCDVVTCTHHHIHENCYCGVHRVVKYLYCPIGSNYHTCIDIQKLRKEKLEKIAKI